MKLIVNYLGRNKKIICLAAVLSVCTGIGALFGWQVREFKDPVTGRITASDRSVVFIWQPSELDGEPGRRVDFHVRRWFIYGLYKTEVTGQIAHEPLEGR